MAFFTRAWHRLRATWAPLPQIDATQWLHTLRPYPFLHSLPLHEQARLRALAAVFLQRKEFFGTHGLTVTDDMALSIAAQACLPLLHWGSPQEALSWYDDFVGIVIHPGHALAQRTTMDGAGVVHHYTEELLGEAMQGGPVMLSWEAVTQGQQQTNQNVVIHEFIHKIDMRNGQADGYPPLPARFMGLHQPQAARECWHDAWATAYAKFQQQVQIAERFGGDWPWLDAYGATAPAEFFAVSCEAYFTNPARFQQEFPSLMPLLNAFFAVPTQH